MKCSLLRINVIVAVVFLAAISRICGCHGLSVHVPASSDSSMWDILDTQPPNQAWKTIFGEMGERGEYMDGYSEKAMLQRCEEDYQWATSMMSAVLDKGAFGFASERSAMMSHLYDNAKLWSYVSMVAFAEHYVLDENQKFSFNTFQRQKKEAFRKNPIFSGVVLRNWETCELKLLKEEKLAKFQENEIDYVRLECNLGTMDDIGDPQQLVDNEMIRSRFCLLAKVAKVCQTQQMIPVILLQVPWRDAEVSVDYFEQAIHALSASLKEEEVEPKKLLFETRPPIGISALEEKNLIGTERIELGLKIGRTMFEIIDKTFTGIVGGIPAGFCVAGGSTKGENPTAMQDDTQNAVRQGMRQYARTQWGYDFCFWEMGAKLMLQPKVGQLWGTDDETTSSKDAARDLFFLNAKDMADEIKADIQII